MGPEQNPFTQELRDLIGDHVIIDNKTGKKVDPFQVHIASREAVYAVFSGTIIGLSIGSAFVFNSPGVTFLSSTLDGGFSEILFLLARNSMSDRREGQLYQFSAAADGLIKNITGDPDYPVPTEPGY